MDFLSTPIPASIGTEVIVEKKRVPWNAGIDYWSNEMKLKQSEVGRRVMSDSERRKIKSELFFAIMQRPEAKEWRQRGSKNRKPVMTPYGKFPSALEAAKQLGPRLGLKPCTIQTYFMRSSKKYAVWYYVEQTA
jgi:hypothetical protein